MSTPFSAGPHALGYYHQVRYALYALLRHRREDATVSIEGLDDVAVEAAGRLDLDQLKHHVRAKASLTDTSADLWKPIRVWAETFGAWDPDTTQLHLITTGLAPGGSAATLLRSAESGDRDVEAARTRLLEAAEASSSASLASAFDAFDALSETDQRKLLRCLVVTDGAPSIVDTVALIEGELGLSVRRQHVTPVRERLEGWWFDQAVRHIWGGSSDPLARADLLDHLFAITDTMTRDNLPLDFATADPVDEPDPESDQRQFVQQLRAIAMGADAIRYAILDYYRAFEQRSRWVREHLLVDDELARYEKLLVEAWERYVARWEDERGTSDEDHLRFGRKVYRWVDQDADIRIRPALPPTHRYVMRGSFHLLADLLPPRVHWHPGFLDRVESVLSGSEPTP